MKHATTFFNSLLLSALLLFSSPATACNRNFSFIALGDMPYQLSETDEQYYPKFEHLIKLVNLAQPQFVVHVGDIKNGISRCSNERFEKTANLFKTFKAPFIYTPGDNEWTDCHRPPAGGYSPTERLDKLREVFYSNTHPYDKDLPIVRQNTMPGFQTFVENARWETNNIVFATIHVIGSNNNLQRNWRQWHKNKEYIVRNAANLAWIDAAFNTAIKQNAKGVVLFMHADPSFHSIHDEKSGFTDVLEKLKTKTLTFGKPVLLIHGDSHRYRIDKPMIAGEYGQIVPNFTRLIVFGEMDTQAVRITVNPKNPQLFEFAPFLVEEQDVLQYCTCQKQTNVPTPCPVH